MSKRAVIATSTGCLDYLDLKEKDLYILRMKIIIKDETYNDFVDINADEFYKMLMEDNKLVPSSSMPSIGEMLDMFEHLDHAGYEEVIMTTISSELSGTYQIAEMAKNQYEGPLKIHIVDTLNAAISEGFIGLEALRLIKENVGTEEIVEYLHKLRTSRKQYFMVDNLRLLVANGRLSGASGFLGSMFKIKPILIVNDEGKIVSYEKIRTQKKSLERMVELLLNDLKNVKNFVITFDTSNNLEGIEYVKREIEKVYPNYRSYEAPITPVIGCHTGIGTVGVAYFDLDI
jgi:DegV family protein with EDD domain